MDTKTLFLAWQDKKSRQWFPVGRLDADVKPPQHIFRYTHGAEEAQKKVKFQPLIEFPNMHKRYRSPELFPLFSNRVIALGRPDRMDYLTNLDLPEDANPVEILSVNGGYRVTDVYEVFPKLVKGDDGRFTCRFFLHGWRHVSEAAKQRLKGLKPEENLYVTLELTNPKTRVAVQIQTEDYHMIGWAPRYVTKDLVAAMAESPEYSASVVQLNPQPAPSKQRVLVEMRGRWDKHEPMTSPDFNPLVE